MSYMQGTWYTVNTGTQFHSGIGCDNDGDGHKDDKGNVSIMLIQALIIFPFEPEKGGLWHKYNLSEQRRGIPHCETAPPTLSSLHVIKA